MKKWLLSLIVLVIIAASVFGQTKITGKVVDDGNNPLPGANIYLKDSYDGTTSQADGSFSFQTSEKGKYVFVVSFVGYKQFQKEIELTGKKIEILVKLEEEITQMSAVVVSAGSFEASDEKKGVILKPLDVLTTGTEADVYSTLTTLPGTQKIGETEGLFVRGGSAAETKSIIDGMIVQKPFFSSVPDLPARGRFSPMLFKGTVFSTGGYSAQYGQALSSVLVLNTTDLPQQTISSISLMAVGFGGSHTQRWENSSLAVEGGYYNLAPYNKIFKQRTEWDKSPESVEGMINFRQKISKNGMLKAFASYSSSKFSLYMPNIDDLSIKDYYKLTPDNFYSNVSYRDILSDDWTVFVGSSYSVDNDRIYFSGNDIKQVQKLAQAKVTVSKKVLDNAYITTGAEFQNTIYDDTYNSLNSNLTENFAAGFVESDIFFTNDLAAKVGIRAEHSKLINKANIAPRISFAYRLGSFDQLNFAYGRFYQTPEKNYLAYTQKLNFENSDHYIANYQYIGDNITFRVELYYKDYHNLTKGTTYAYPYFNLPYVPFGNSGKGYAKGVDIFWRDSKTIPLTDYWISYSYLDTKRDFGNFPSMAFPTFASPHTLSLVLKHWFESISSYVSLTYTHAEGRPYFNPNNPEFLGDRAKSYNNLSGNIAFVTSIYKNETVIFFSVDNILGFSNVYGYRYSSDGKISNPVLPPIMRSAFLGIFVSIGETSQYQ
jgi:hypothetical protein